MEPPRGSLLLIPLIHPFSSPGGGPFHPGPPHANGDTSNGSAHRDSTTHALVPARDLVPACSFIVCSWPGAVSWHTII
jgi:hypothetical protein